MIETFILKVKRAETPFYARLKGIIQNVPKLRVPVPRFLFAPLSLIYHLHYALINTLRFLWTRVYREPLFRSLCDSIGKNLYLEQLPFVSGSVSVVIGDDVTISGALTVTAGRTYDRPELIIGDRVFIGHQVVFSVGQKVVVEEGAAIAGGCYISDNDGHPKSLEARMNKLHTPPDEVFPVRICRNAWIGRGSFIMKGVTVGEGAVVGVGSVVVGDVPPFSTAIGSPARLLPARPPTPLQAPIDTKRVDK